MSAVQEAFGRVDILVNNAGVASGARVDKLAEAVWDANFDTNMKGTFLMCQAVSPIMQRQASGRILNAASFAAIIPSIGSAAYAASKSAVVQFTRVLAGELGPFNVTVNSYSPGSAAGATPRMSPTSSASSPPTRPSTSPAPRSTARAASTPRSFRQRHTRAEAAPHSALALSGR